MIGLRAELKAAFDLKKADLAYDGYTILGFHYGTLPIHCSREKMSNPRVPRVSAT